MLHSDEFVVPANSAQLEAMTRCGIAFLTFWRLREQLKAAATATGDALNNGGSHVDAILKRAKDSMMELESGVSEKEAKSRKYREKIMAMQKR